MEEISRNIQTRRDFWISKIQKNKERDKEVNEQLTHEGWLVLRYWESQIKKDANGVAEEIISYLPVKHVQKKSSDFSKIAAFSIYLDSVGPPA